MKNLSKQILSTIKHELTLINQKINSTYLLEILKYKIIDLLKNENNISTLKNDENDLIEKILDNETRKLAIKLIYSKTSLIKSKHILNNDILIISIKELIDISVQDNKTNKLFNFKCSPNTGIVITKGSNCMLNFRKESLRLEVTIEDELIKVENIKDSTI
tara:strand:- start:11493 stop:11975 length:483 start_codon:yes stop_codon:yes gene_type:complete